jgi:hypothetical protein
MRSKTIISTLAVLASAFVPLGVATSVSATDPDQTKEGRIDQTAGRELPPEEVTPFGIGRRTTIKVGSTWVHHLPRINTNPSHVFTAHPGEHIATICWMPGDNWNGVTRWDLIVDRSQNNAVGYVSSFYVDWPSDTECGAS